MINLRDFFKFEDHGGPHVRHDPPGSEDADVNNDGKVDKNDKYMMAKRRLYKQYQATQKSTKSTEFSTPKLENYMIRLSGLVNLKALKEESHEEPTSTPTKSVDKAKVEMKLKKLKEMQMDKEQEKKVDELLSKMEELTAGQKKLDVDKDGKIEGDDLAKLRAGKKADEEIGPKDQVDAGEYDYEGDMAKNQLQTTIRNAQALHDMLEDDTNLPEWVQSKITLAKEYIQSAADYITSEKAQSDSSTDKDLEAMKEAVNEAAPEGWEKTVLAMKKHKDIDNPWALAHWMKKKGYHSQKESKKDGE